MAQKKILVIILIIVAILAAAGWFFRGYLATNVLSFDKDAVTVETAQWPSDLPPFLPPFTDGTVKTVSRVSAKHKWIVVMENVSADALAKYRENLTKAGWTPEGQSDLFFEGLKFSKNGWQVTVAADKSGNAVLNAVFSPQK